MGSDGRQLTIEHLTKDGMGGSREIEIERVIGLSLAYTLQLIVGTHLSEIVELKDKFLG